MFIVQNIVCMYKIIKIIREYFTLAGEDLNNSTITSYTISHKYGKRGRYSYRYK